VLAADSLSASNSPLAEPLLLRHPVRPRLRRAAALVCVIRHRRCSLEPCPCSPKFGDSTAYPHRVVDVVQSSEPNASTVTITPSHQHLCHRRVTSSTVVKASLRPIDPVFRSLHVISEGRRKVQFLHATSTFNFKLTTTTIFLIFKCACETQIN
jgi:hypothetical protein